jgi:membrane protein implicated in regulation of membrane protease activity
MKTALYVLLAFGLALAWAGLVVVTTPDNWQVFVGGVLMYLASAIAGAADRRLRRRKTDTTSLLRSRMTGMNVYGTVSPKYPEGLVIRDNTFHGNTARFEVKR